MDDPQECLNQTMFALSFRNARISRERFVWFLQPVVSMPYNKNIEA
jgi:hypothetical protein